MTECGGSEQISCCGECEMFEVCRREVGAIAGDKGCKVFLPAAFFRRACDV